MCSIRQGRATGSLLRGCVVIPLLAILLGAAPAVVGAADRQSFLIVLDGTFAEFVMYCTLIDDDNRQSIRRREYLPHSYRFAAEAISCSITLLEFRGRISASLYVGDRLIVSASQNAVRPVVKVRSDGPWGPARGAKSAIPIQPHSRPDSPDKRGKNGEQLAP